MKETAKSHFVPQRQQRANDTLTVKRIEDEPGVLDTFMSVAVEQQTIISQDQVSDVPFNALLLVLFQRPVLQRQSRERKSNHHNYHHLRATSWLVSVGHDITGQ